MVAFNYKTWAGLNPFSLKAVSNQFLSLLFLQGLIYKACLLSFIVPNFELFSRIKTSFGNTCNFELSDLTIKQTITRTNVFFNSVQIPTKKNSTYQNQNLKTCNDIGDALSNKGSIPNSI